MAGDGWTVVVVNATVMCNSAEPINFQYLLHPSHISELHARYLIQMNLTSSFQRDKLHEEEKLVRDTVIAQSSEGFSRIRSGGGCS